MEPKKQMKLKNKEKPDAPKNITPPPSPSAVKSSLEAARSKVVAAFQVFHKMLTNKKLDRNKSPQEKKEESSVAQSLFNAAGELDQLNAGEGVMLTASIGLRELIKLRDRLNEVEYTSLLTRKELNELRESLGESKKQQDKL